jgi:hypothetical protein
VLRHSIPTRAGLDLRAGRIYANCVGQLSLSYVTTLLLLDAALLITLIVWFLRRHGERPLDVFLGSRPVKPEVVLGIR